MMVCNHCTKGSMEYVRTRHGAVCVSCRDEIIAASVRKDDPPYPFCSQPDVCTPCGYCRRDPCCAD